MRFHRAAAIAIFVLATLVPSTIARAQSGEPDSIGSYLRVLADSTDLFFGEAAAPVDTAGFDSALAVGLAKRPRRERVDLSPSIGPWLAFDRADGPFWGATVGFGEPEQSLGRLSVRAGYAVGPNEWRGGGRYQKTWAGPRAGTRRRITDDVAQWTLDVSGGRFEGILDPDKRLTVFRRARSFFHGSDRENYLLREGFRVAVQRQSDRWRASLAFRDEIESPLVTTTTWNLLRRELEVVENLPAAQGRAAEARGDIGIRFPGIGAQIDGWVATASEALGSDFEYTRMRVAAGMERPIGGFASLVPQIEYGRLTGDAIPQASFYLGGSHSLRSFPTGSFAGTVKALGRLELYFPHDLLELARIPHPSMFPISASLFTASGAVSGVDPFGGPPIEGETWPDRSAWRSEVGAALLWRPGIPNPLGFVRFDATWQVGPGEGRRFSIEYSVPMDLLRSFE